MQLYTVEFQTAHMVSKFDAKGNKISDTTTMITQTVRDLPMSTAQMYKAKDAYGTCVIIPQESAVSVRRKHDVRFSDIQSGKSTRVEPVRTKGKAATKPTPVNGALHRAAATGDMTAAINAGD